jgi:hypothetical protein
MPNNAVEATGYRRLTADVGRKETMKNMLTALLIASAVSVIADDQRMTGLPARDDVFVIAVAPHSKELKDHFTPDSLLQALPKLVPSDVLLPVGDKLFWQSGVIVLKDKTVLFWRTCGNWFIAVDKPMGTMFYAFEKKEAPNQPSDRTR